MTTIRNYWDKTAGYKTKSGAVLLALYTMIQAMAPELLTGQTENIVRSSIDFLIITGGADWVWRNRKKITEKIINIFKRNKNN